MSTLAATSTRVARLCAAIAVAVGTAVLLGWILNNSALKSILPIWVSMKANTASCFVLLGLSLALSVIGGGGRRVKHVAIALAVAVTVVAALTLSQYLTHADLGIDQLLFREPAGTVGTAYPGRMALPTAVNFVLLGFALAFFDRKSTWLVQIPTIVVGCISLLTVAGYLYNVEELERIGPTNTAAHTAFAFLVLSLGVLSAQAGHGLMRFLTEDGADGVMLRRLLPAIIVVPYLVGAAIAVGARWRFYEPSFALALFALATMLILVSFASWNALDLRRMDDDRQRTLDSLRTSESRLQSLVVDLEGFTYSISHVLRAPLRAIDGFSAMLADRQGASQDQEAGRLLSMIRANVTQMAEFLDATLAFSRAGNAKLTPVDLDMADLTDAVWSEIEPARRGRDIVLVRGMLPHAYADASLTREVLRNVLENAVKFTSPTPDARVEIEGRQQQDMAIYEIRDNGVGFDMRYSDKLFGVFQRLHDDEFPGTGIGLAVAKRIVDRQGGWIRAEGVPGDGATCCFALPLAKVDEPGGI